MHNNIEEDEIQEVFNILSRYYHTTDRDVIKELLNEDLVSISHASRIFSFYGDDPKKFIQAIISEYGEDIINRKMSNTLKKIVNQNKSK